jgi:D-sedoheptulose 7-phosphate isomerase
MKKNFHSRIESCKAALDGLCNIEAQIIQASDVLVNALHSGKRIYACGNGGSAAEAMHFATELSGRYRSNRIPFPAIALTADGTALTCIGNDFGWDQIFARQLEAHAQPDDVLLVLTTSGNSPNVITALKVAKRLGLKTIGLLGNDGGLALSLCEMPIVIASRDTGSIQEAHLVIIHILCEALEPDECDGTANHQSAAH